MLIGWVNICIRSQRSSDWYRHKWASFLKSLVPLPDAFTMQLLAWIYLLSWFLPWVKSAYDVVEPTVGQNITEYLHARQKRHQLIYRNGGTIRLVVGAVMSTQLEDPVVWRSMVYYYVLHFGAFTLPSAPLYPWDKWETIYARSLQEKIRSLDESHEDDTRTFAYAALENYMDQVSGSVGRGRQCLLRGICENAQVHHHHGIMAELLNVLLTPGKTRLNLAYTEALSAGKAGINCFSHFPDCPRGESILDAYSVDLDY
ncbi:uncharacterized protein LOC128257394 [Drosophila gunungcola]|uniref:uncharacterized protein LOC128257394 n=1 Tax=Drosophila gunungcola TaxID=103775 RepID=UPI0022E46C83|nr:uncharacterized protein LOC128257394 [Drosophila gunungcola]